MVVAEAAKAASQADQQQWIGKFYGEYFGWVNFLGLILQLFLVSRIFKYIGVRGALFVLPSLALLGYSLVLFAPLLAVVRIAKILENSTGYSLQNTARHALFLPVSREAKYKAKSAIDAFFWRIGDLLQAAIVFVGTQMALDIRGYGSGKSDVRCIVVGPGRGLHREHRKLSPNPASP